MPTSGTAWSQVRGAVMLSNTVYTAWSDGEVCAVLTVAAADERIDQVLWVLNPAKIASFAAS